MTKYYDRMHHHAPLILITVCACSGPATTDTTSNLDDPVPAIQAFIAGCNASDLSDKTDLSRADPEWAPVIKDALHPFPNDPPTILEGRVPSSFEHLGHLPSINSETASDISEEDLPWTHYTHDKTTFVVPDPGYRHLLSSWLPEPNSGCPPGSVTNGRNCEHSDIEVEWDNASPMRELNDSGNQRGSDQVWGAMPEFVWPSVNDRVWIEGRWIFDCGHPGSGNVANVSFETEIHPPRAFVTFRQHTAANEDALPITGENTRVPLTQADIFASGNGGEANDACAIFLPEIPVIYPNGYKNCSSTGPIIPINDRNYIFDIYPPGTDFTHKNPNGTFSITVPTRDGSGSDVSLNWRTIDQSSQIPGHSGATTVTPILCPIDEATPAPNQTETSCPPLPVHPTRLRVVLPFAGTNADTFAGTILLGWDDVPVASAPQLRKFAIRLHQLDVINNGEGPTPDGDWRVFASVNGEWRYLSDDFDRRSDGSNACHGDALTENGNGDCFRWDLNPWIVSVLDGTPIHVSIGGFESDSVDGQFCRNVNGCRADNGAVDKLATANDDRIGTMEFDIQPGDYQRGDLQTSGVTLIDLLTFQTPKTSDGENYRVAFTVQEIPRLSGAISDPLMFTGPSFINNGLTYVTSQSGIEISTQFTKSVGFQYRTRLDGQPLPIFPSAFPFPLHWNITDLQPGPRRISLALSGPSGVYTLEYSTQTGEGVTEPRNVARVVLDDIPPVITILQPSETTYPHSAKLLLDYHIQDGNGVGVENVTATMDGQTTVAGKSLNSGTMIDLLTMTLGKHEFRIDAVDHLGNSSTKDAIFSIIVTPASIITDIQQFQASGDISKQGIVDSLISKLDNAANARLRGDCRTAANIYGAFAHEVQAQDSKSISSAAAATLLADAEYLQEHCP